jgi:hypothetical protein
MTANDERKAWLSGLKIGDDVKLTTLLGFHRGKITQKSEDQITVKIISEDDKDITGWEVHLLGNGGGLPNRVCNRIDPLPDDSAQPAPVLEYIGEPTKDLPFGGWEAA